MHTITKAKGLATMVALALLMACPLSVEEETATGATIPEEASPPGAPSLLPSPPAPVVTAGEAVLRLSWTAVPGATAYEVWYHTADSAAAAVQNGGDIPETSFTLGPLNPGTRYWVWLKAKNAQGTSGFSPSASGLPSHPLSAPAAPSAPSITAGDGMLRLSWTTVAGATAYEVWYHTADDPSAALRSGGDIAATEHDIVGVLNFTRLFVWLKAKNAIGTSAFGIVAQGTPGAAPVSPSAPSLQAGNAQVGVSWSAVAHASAYEVWYNASNDPNSAARSGGDITGTGHTITGLSNFSSVYVWLKAKNAYGGSGYSPSSSTTPVGPPAAPEQPSVTPGNNSLTFAWAAVPGATSYDIYLSLDENERYFLTNQIGTQLPLTGLTNGTIYYFWVIASNAHGKSAFSLMASGAPGLPPAAPGMPSLTPGIRQLGVSWTAVPNAASYEIWYGAGSDPQVMIATSGTSYTVSGLIPNCQYSVALKAVNHAGTSLSGPGATGVPLDGRPVVVTSAIVGNLDLTTHLEGTSAKVRGQVTSQGDSAVSERGFCWNTSGNPTLSDSKKSSGSGAGTFEADLTGLSVNTQYHLRAYAVNNDGVAYGEPVTFNSGHAMGTLRSYGAGGVQGYVFYNDGLGGGKMARQSDSAATASWSEDYVLVTNLKAGFGEGTANTDRIRAVLGDTAQYAARFIRAGDANQYMPSRDELLLMYQKLKSRGIGGFSDAIYWSSWDAGGYSNSAAGVNFTNGQSSLHIDKKAAHRLRAAKDF